jgi:hypothetical protein
VDGKTIGEDGKTLREEDFKTGKDELRTGNALKKPEVNASGFGFAYKLISEYPLAVIPADAGICFSKEVTTAVLKTDPASSAG